MSIVSGTTNAVLQSQSQADATRANLENARLDRELSLRMFGRGRGAENTPVFSPWYSGTYEPDVLYPGAQAAFAGAFPTSPDARKRTLANYTALQAGLAPAFAGGTRAVNDIFSGALTSQRIANAAPVAAARTAKGATTAAAAMEALKERYAALNAGTTRKGYTGGGTASMLPFLRASFEQRQAGSNDIAQAALDNALMFNSIRDQGLSLPLQSLNLPLQQFNQSAQFANAPNQALVDQFMKAYGPLGIFNINPEAFHPAATPTVPANAGPLAATSGVVGSFGNSLLNMYTSQQQAKLWQDALRNSQYGSPPTSSGHYNDPTAGMYGTGAGSGVDWEAIDWGGGGY